MLLPTENLIIRKGIEMIDKNIKTLISIIMPVYNSEKYLKDAIESVLAQTYHNFELILIDDGSSDGSSSICDQYAKKDDRIQVIHKNNAGVCSARNQGMDIAKGDYVCFIDNDDIYDKQYLETMVAILSEQLFDIVKCGRRNIRITPELVETKKTDFSFKESRSYTIDEFVQDYYEIKKTGCFNSIWNGIYSVSFLKNNNIRFNESVKHGNEDLIFNYTALEYEPRIFLVKDVLYTHYYRISHSTSTKYYPDQVGTRIDAIEIENRFLDNHGCSQNRDLIYFEQMRECFRIMAQCKDKKERRDGTNEVVKRLDLSHKLGNISSKSVCGVQKLDWLLYKNKWFDLYYFYKNIQSKIQG